MKAYDFEAYVIDGEIYCCGCEPKASDPGDWFPIFAGSEWDYAPACSACGYVHDYVSIIGGE